MNNCEIFTAYLSLIGRNKHILSFISLDDIVSTIKNNDNTVTTLCLNKVITSQQVIDLISHSLDLSNTNHHKFNLVILGDVLENIIDPINLLNMLRDHVHESAMILFHVRNSTHGLSRIQFFNGNFLQSKSLNHFTLDSVLTLLEEVGCKLVTLHRIKKDLIDNAEIVAYAIPSELIDAIKFDPESTTNYYVISAVYVLKNTVHVRQALTNFHNTMCSEYLRNILHYYKNRMNNTQTNISIDEALINKLVNDIELLQNVNIANRKLIDQYVLKINNLVSEIDLLQKINLQHQEIIKQKDREIQNLNQK